MRINPKMDSRFDTLRDPFWFQLRLILWFVSVIYLFNSGYISEYDPIYPDNYCGFISNYFGMHAGLKFISLSDPFRG